jgi:biotin transporter BioY
MKWQYKTFLLNNKNYITCLILALLPLICVLAIGRDYIYFRTFFFLLAGYLLGNKWGTLSQVLFCGLLLIINPSWLGQSSNFIEQIGFYLGGIIIAYWIGSYHTKSKLPIVVSIIVALFFVFAIFLIYQQSLKLPFYFIYPFIVAFAAFVYYFFRLFKKRRLVFLFSSGVILSYIFYFAFLYLAKRNLPLFDRPFILFTSLIPGDFLTLLVTAFIFPQIRGYLVNRNLIIVEKAS